MQQLDLSMRTASPATLDEAIRDAFRMLAPQVRRGGLDGALRNEPLAKCLRLQAAVLMKKGAPQ